MLIEVTPTPDNGYLVLVKSEDNFDYAIRRGFLSPESATEWARRVARKFEYNRKNLDEMTPHAWTQASQEREGAIRAADVALPDWDGS